jgi:endonuclease-3
VLDELVATVLSQHTSDRNSERAFASLKERFPAWEDVLAAPAQEVADAIRMGGIADQKAVRIQRILAIVAEREGRLDLSRLHELDDDAVEAYLTSLPGVGHKTAACVLTFSMGRAAFPVDTHVHRVATRLGWAGTRAPGGRGGAASATAARAHEVLRALVPADIRYDLHLALIAHGRRVCTARRPACETCAVCGLCAYGRSRLQ